MIVRVTEPAPDPKVGESAPDPKVALPHGNDLSKLREDLSKEYYEALHVVLDFHGRLITIKGWSVTVSLAALALGFQQRHYALFALAAVTGAGFWAFDTVMKRFQYRYFTRLQEIEHTAYLINPVSFKGEYGDKAISAPRINMTWRLQDDLVKRGPRASERNASLDWPAAEPSRPKEWVIYQDLRSCWWWRSVMFPHVIAVTLGVLLLIIFAVLSARGFHHWRL